MNITPRQLSAFVAVAEEESITRAAEVLGLPQSSISTQLQDLEKALGLRLFDRHTRMLQLTSAGAEILPLAQKTLADLDAIVGGSEQLKTLGRGRVSIAAASVQAALVLPRMVKAFSELHPGIKIALFDVTQDDVLSMVQSGAVDIGVGTAFGGHSGLHMRTLWTEPFCAVVPHKHALDGKRFVTWKELQKYPLIGSRKGNPVRALLDFGLAKDGVALTITHETALPLTTAGMVAGGMGVGILTGSVRRLVETLGLVLIPIHQPVIQREVVQVSHAGRSLSPAAKKFSETLIEWTAAPSGGREPRNRRKMRFCNLCYQFDCDLHR